MKKSKYEIDNIVIIGKTEFIERYIFSIVERAHPKNYNRFGSILIQTTDSKLDFTEKIIQKLSWLGLKEVSRKRTKLKVFNRDGEGYVLPNAWEIQLCKINILNKLGEEWGDE